MPSSHRFEPSAIKNKQKREQVFHKAKKEKGQAKLHRRLAIAKREADDPKAKKVCTLFTRRY
jgi:ribosome production factor 1